MATVVSEESKSLQEQQQQQKEQEELKADVQEVQEEQGQALPIGEIVAAAYKRLAAVAEAGEEAGPTVEYSFEYFPPRTAEGMKTLYENWWDMFQQSPCFADITWGAGGSTSERTLQMSRDAAQRLGFPVNMHLTCTNMPVEMVHEALREAKKMGVRSICALRGDPPHGQTTWKPVEGGFSCALDLIQFIRKEYGDWFGISCAGYPEGHPAAMTKVDADYAFSASELGRRSLVDGEFWVCRDEDYQKELQYLKAKVDAGADVIITQLFYSAEVFLKFVQDCRLMGIQVPILPGIMPIVTLGGFKRMTAFCKTHIPEDLQELLQRFSDEDADTQAFLKEAMHYVVGICKKIVEAGHKFLHIYTMNKTEPVYDLLENLGAKINRNLEMPEQTKEDLRSWAAAFTN